MKTGIIVPCYNEEKRLNVKAYLKFIKQNYDFHFCFVNDGSTDNTLKTLKVMKDEAPSDISIINMRKNKGKAAAVRAGSRYLFNKKDIKYIGFIDADLSTDFEELKNLIKSLDKNKNLLLVYGSRENGNGNRNIRRNAFRNVFSKAINFFIAGLILGLPIKDTQCGAKIFRKAIIPMIFLKGFLSRWLFDLEIFMRLKIHFGENNVMEIIKEQSLQRWVHVADSKISFKDSIKIPFMLCKIWAFYSLSKEVNLFKRNSFEAFDKIRLLEYN